MTGTRHPLFSAVLWPPAVMAVVVLCVGLVAPDALRGRSPLPGPSHRYAPHEPAWSQIVFPELGAHTITVASVSSAAARLAGGTPAGPRASWFPVACYLSAVLLFSWLLAEFGFHPLSVTGAALAFACSSAVWSSVGMWSPYVALLPLALGVVLLTVRGINRGALRVWSAGVLLMLTAAESLAAFPLVAAWPWATRAAAKRRGAQGPRTIWIVAALALVAGVLLHVLSAAIVWRALSGSTQDEMVSWSTSIWTVTGSWLGVLASYLPHAPLGESVAVAREWLRGIGLVGAMLAVAGVVWSWRPWGGERWLGPVLLALVFACTVMLGSTVSDARPLLPLLAAGSFLFAAAGLEWVRARSAGYVALVGVVIALGLMSCVNSLVLAGRAQGATFDDALDQVIDEFRGPTAMVADSAEVDRRLVAAMARAGWRNQWFRVAQDSTAIRQAIAEGRQVLAFDESAGALEALGWALTSPREWTVESPGRRVVKVWSVEPPGAHDETRADRPRPD